MKLITDTSALYTIQQGETKGFTVIPLCVSIHDQHYRDLCFDSAVFYEEIKAGYIPTSSQPPIGEVIEIYESFPDEEILHICMADGLSGTYQSALSARESISDKERVTVLNSETLCGPHRYLVEKAHRLMQEGKAMKEIIASLQVSIAQTNSFLIPQDFGFLKRGGRLKPAAATLGGLLKLKPVMMAVDNGTRLDKFTISRTLTQAAGAVLDFFSKQGVNGDYHIYVAHSRAEKAAMKIMDALQAMFPDAVYEMLELSPAFITQGGPDCIAIQYIHK